MSFSNLRFTIAIAISCVVFVNQPVYSSGSFQFTNDDVVFQHDGKLLPIVKISGEASPVESSVEYAVDQLTSGTSNRDVEVKKAEQCVCKGDAVAEVENTPPEKPKTDLKGYKLYVIALPREETGGQQEPVKVEAPARFDQQDVPEEGKGVAEETKVESIDPEAEVAPKEEIEEKIPSEKKGKNKEKGHEKDKGQEKKRSKRDTKGNTLKSGKGAGGRGKTNRKRKDKSTKSN